MSHVNQTLRELVTCVRALRVVYVSFVGVFLRVSFAGLFCGSLWRSDGLCHCYVLAHCNTLQYTATHCNTL